MVRRRRQLNGHLLHRTFYGYMCIDIAFNVDSPVWWTILRRGGALFARTTRAIARFMLNGTPTAKVLRELIVN